MKHAQRLLSASIIILAGYTMVGCSGSETATRGPTAPSESSSTDEAYLEAVRAEFSELETTPDDELVDIGEGICHVMEDIDINEYSLEAVFDSFYEGADAQFSYGEIAYLFGAATASYCPQAYDDMMNVLGN